LQTARPFRLWLLVLTWLLYAPIVSAAARSTLPRGPAEHVFLQPMLVGRASISAPRGAPAVGGRVEPRATHVRLERTRPSLGDPKTDCGAHPLAALLKLETIWETAGGGWLAAPAARHFSVTTWRSNAALARGPPV
jgi:hypothetical protein